MPKKNTKRTRSKKQKKFDNPLEGAFYELFHPDSEGRLLNYDELKLIDLKQLHLVNGGDLKLIDKKYLFSLLHVPSLIAFTQYVGAFVLSGILLLGIFSLYASMLTRTVQTADTIAQLYYNEKKAEVVEQQLAARKLDMVSKKSRELRTERQEKELLSKSQLAVVKSSTVRVVDFQDEPKLERSRHITVVKSRPADLAKKEANEEKIIALATGDERIFRVYEVDKEPSNLAYSNNILGTSTVSKVSTEPVCSFSYGTKKLASGASLYVTSKSEGKIYIDYSGEAAKSVALVNGEKTGASSVVNYVDLSEVETIDDLKVNVLNENNEYIGSCNLSVGNSTLASL